MSRHLRQTKCMFLAMCMASMIQVSANAQQAIFFSDATMEAPMPVITRSYTMGAAGGAYLPNSNSDLLRMPQIANELGLDEDQKSTINELRKAFRQQAQEVMRSVDFGSDNASMVMREAQRKLREKADEKLEELLLPGQLERLKQIRIQSALRTRGALALMSGELGEEIRLTDKQKGLLKQVHAKKQAELQIEIAKLRESYLQETVEAVLDDAQASKLKTLSGDKYEVKKPDYSKMLGRLNPRRKKDTDKAKD